MKALLDRAQEHHVRDDVRQPGRNQPKALDEREIVMMLLASCRRGRGETHPARRTGSSRNPSHS
jgi:hypothetical protein